MLYVIMKSGCDIIIKGSYSEQAACEASIQGELSKFFEYDNAGLESLHSGLSTAMRALSEEYGLGLVIGFAENFVSQNDLSLDLQAVFSSVISDLS